MAAALEGGENSTNTKVKVKCSRYRPGCGPERG